MFQPIPTNLLLTREQHIRLHRTTRKGGRSKNWINEHNFFIQEWASRLQHNVIGAYSTSPIASQEYMQWYLQRTVVYTTNPTHQDENPHGFQNEGQRLRLMVCFSRNTLMFFYTF